MNFPAKHPSLSLIIHSAGTVHLNNWAARCSKEETAANKNDLVQMLGQMYPRQKYVPAPLYFWKVYFPEINSGAGEEGKGKLCQRRSSRLHQLRSGPLKNPTCGFCQMYRDDFEREREIEGFQRISDQRYLQFAWLMISCNQLPLPVTSWTLSGGSCWLRRWRRVQLPPPAGWLRNWEWQERESWGRTHRSPAHHSLPDPSTCTTMDMSLCKNICQWKFILNLVRPDSGFVSCAILSTILHWVYLTWREKWSNRFGFLTNMSLKPLTHKNSKDMLWQNIGIWKLSIDVLGSVHG